MKSLLLFVGQSSPTVDLLNHLFATRYRTATYPTVNEALEYLESVAQDERPALVICDQQSPEDTTPIELFRGLKNSHLYNTLPTIVLCSESKTATEMTTLSELGWSEKLYKPFNPENLTIRVRQLLSLLQ